MDEREFVEVLRDFWSAQKKAWLIGVEVFLLRNLSRGTRIGFSKEQRFYPDFILWILEPGRKSIAFLEPNSMHRAGAYNHDKKNERLLILSVEIATQDYADAATCSY